MSKLKYTVTGTRTYRGHAPGETFTAEPDEALGRAIARRSISEGTAAETLESRSRAQLNELAAAAGVNAPEDLPNKDAVVEAIRSADEKE